MNRRAFLTALSALPAVALFPGLVRAESLMEGKGPLYCRVQLYLMYRAMGFFGDRPDALYVSPKAMLSLAEQFRVKVDYDEFEHPWGGDICGTPFVQENRIEVAAGFGLRTSRRPRSTLYFFKWDEDVFVRHQAGHLAVSYSLREVLYQDV